MSSKTCLPQHEHVPPPPPKGRIGKKVKGPEQRIEINPLDAVPYKWICKITMFTEDPATVIKPAYGTGFLINIPNSTQCIVLTAAHNLYVHPGPQNPNAKPGYITAAFVNLPGRRQIEVSDKDIHVPEAYKVFPYSSNHLTYDYGTIILLAAKKEEMDCGFGFSATLTDREILESDLSVFGYPYVLPNEPPTLEDVRSLHGSGGRVQSVSEKNLRYVVHTSSGQSGGPVFIWSRGFWTVIGIHVKFENLAEYTINSAVRLTVSLMQDIMSWISYKYFNVSILSHNRYLSIPTCAPSDLAIYPDIAFTDHADGSTVVHFIPVKSYPEGCKTGFSDNVWVISSKAHQDTYLCFDRETILNGVAVNSRFSKTPILRRSPELVQMEKKGEGYSIMPVRFPETVESLKKTMRFDITEVKLVKAGEKDVV